MVATDDLIHAGTIAREERMGALQQKFKFGKWETTTGLFCGKDMVQDSDGAIHISQDSTCQTSVKIAVVSPKDQTLMMIPGVIVHKSKNCDPK